MLSSQLGFKPFRTKIHMCLAAKECGNCVMNRKLGAIGILSTLVISTNTSKERDLRVGQEQGQPNRTQSKTTREGALTPFFLKTIPGSRTLGRSSAEKHGGKCAYLEALTGTKVTSQLREQGPLVEFVKEGRGV